MRSQGTINEGYPAPLGVVLLGLILIFSAPLRAQNPGEAIQEIVGHIDPGESIVYTLPNMKKGRTLYLHLRGTSGNLDPLLAIFKPGLDVPVSRRKFRAEVTQAIVAGADPLVAVPEIARKFCLAWDDDSGSGYAASLKFAIPDDGDYQVNLGSSFHRETAGKYRLLIGLDAPGVANGEVAGTGASIAILNRAASPAVTAVEEVTGKLDAERAKTPFTLNPRNAGETLTLFVEATEGDLAPILVLEDYGGKPLRHANYLGSQQQASLQYTFPTDATNYRVLVKAGQDNGKTTTGSFRLLLGANAPDVLGGTVQPTGPPVLRKPMSVKVGIKLDQITGVDQKNENFSIVATLWMQWRDPALAFSPDRTRSQQLVFHGAEIGTYAQSCGAILPEFILHNQQGNRWTQNLVVVIHPDGEAIRLERFSVTLQAPNFDFRKFPFDVQHFYVHADALYRQELIEFTDFKEFSAIGNKLGEEEWIAGDLQTGITSTPGTTGQVITRFSFDFHAHRHLTYYIFRIFVPIGIILLIAWISFLMADLGKRVDIASANLLLFIAFNFTIASDLPRLGYLTFLDTVLVGTFVLGGTTLIYNVYLKKSATGDQSSLLEQIDRRMIWIYPTILFGGLLILMLLYLAM